MVCRFVILFCAVFISNSVRLCGIRTPVMPPSIGCKQSLFCSKIYEWVQYVSVYTGLLIFCAVAEIPQKTRNTAKSARNISKYMSAKHISYLSWLLDLFYSPQTSKFILKTTFQNYQAFLDERCEKLGTNHNLNSFSIRSFFERTVG